MSTGFLFNFTLDINRNNCDNNHTELLPTTANTWFGLGSFVCGCTLLLVSLIGCIGNGLMIIVFHRYSTPSSINILLSGQALIDILLLLFGTPLFSAMAIYGYYQEETLLYAMFYMIVTVYPVGMTAQTATVWAMILITAERYLAVCHPFRAKSICTVTKAKLSLLALVTCSLLYNGCRFWEYELSANGTVTPWLRNNRLYVVYYYNWAYFFVMFLVPFLSLTVINGAIIRTILKARRQRLRFSVRQNREYQTALMMALITVLFIACNSLAFVLKAVEAGNVNICIDQSPSCLTSKPFYYFLIDLNNLLVEINSSVPFFIFYTFSANFRHRLNRLRNFCLLRYSKRNGAVVTSTADNNKSIYLEGPSEMCVYNERESPPLFKPKISEENVGYYKF